MNYLIAEIKAFNTKIAKKNLRNEQDISGEPMYPSGQVHTAWCLITMQLAFGAQTLDAAQGLMHFLDWHAV